MNLRRELSRRAGHEGTEMTVRDTFADDSALDVTLHLGDTVWLKSGPHLIVSDDAKAAADAFYDLTGLTPDQFEEEYARAHAPAPALDVYRDHQRAKADREARLRDIARGAIERHLGDVCDPDDPDNQNADAIYDQAFRLAHDALIDRGINGPEAVRIASEQATLVATP